MAQSSARLFKNSTGVALDGQHPGATSDMTTKTFTHGRIKKADYDPASQQLDLYWDSKSVIAYKHVPQEVFRRLCAAPNPTTYWEDRIAEEYPKGIPRKSSADSDEVKKLNDLFGGGD
jgi:KTSC domain